MSDLYPARRIAQGALLIGSIVAAGALAVTVAHFGFGVEVADRNTAKPATSWSLALGLLFLGTMGTVIAAVSALVLSTARKHNGR